MSLTSPISVYDPEWPIRFSEAAADLAPLFGEHLVEIHHVGSTAVPKLCAKPEIDILVVIDPAAAERDWSIELSSLGYGRGRDLSVGHQFYKRNCDGRRTHKLHVCVSTHKHIKRMVQFREMLRDDKALRLEYASLKRELERTNRQGIAEYLEQKEPFIRKAMAERFNNEI